MQRLYIIALRLAAAAAAASAAAAAAAAVVVEESTETQVKAAYVLNFARFTEWPTQAFKDVRAPFVICVLGNADTVSGFSSVDGKTVQGRETRVRANPRGAEMLGCHVLYLSKSDAAQSGPALRTSAGNPILTVSDMQGFAGSGGMLGLVPVDGRIGFEANAEAARAAGLRFGAQLLKLARVVY